MLDAAFAQVATSISAAFGGPFHAGTLHWPGTPVRDDGGSIVTPGTPEQFPCQAQIDAVTEAMRAEEGFTERDVRLLVLAPGLGKPVDTKATLVITAGPHAGTWSIESNTFDTLAFAYDGRGRKIL